MTKKLSTNHKTILIIASYNINNLTNHLAILWHYSKTQRICIFQKLQKWINFLKEKLVIHFLSGEPDHRLQLLLDFKWPNTPNDLQVEWISNHTCTIVKVLCWFTMASSNAPFIKNILWLTCEWITSKLHLSY
jgi:hypothetical protein